jgi:hypothetical protein
MIRLKRIRTETAIPADFRGPKRITRNARLIEQKKTGLLDGSSVKKWDAGVWKKAKAQLLKESRNKCAYCETPVTVTAYGDVEHFRPKSQYWWLAYSYENYLPSCIVCNQQFKKDGFPLDASGKRWAGPSVTARLTPQKQSELAKRLNLDPLNEKEGMSRRTFTTAIRKEKALILDPYTDDPAAYFAYEAVWTVRQVLVRPLAPVHQPVVEACERYFGINRNDLADLRFQAYVHYMTYRQLLELPSLPALMKKGIRQRLKEMAGEKAAYAGMIRFFDTQPLKDLPWSFDLSPAE